MVTEKKLLIYVHIPFCPSKCHFCFWVKNIPAKELLIGGEDPQRKAYIKAIRRQIKHHSALLTEQGYRPALMYWGGGTPGTLSAGEFTDIMEALSDGFDLSGIGEATIESTPDVLTPEKLAAYRESGFDRVSLGVQTFDDKRLKKFGRAHSSEQAQAAVHMAAEAGFREINVDLMCGMPGEEAEETRNSVLAALRLPITHVTLYPYWPSPGTVMHRQLDRGRMQLDRGERQESYALGRKLLLDAGFPEYWPNYFGLHPCVGDLAYYRLEMDWIGFGAGANSILNQQFIMNHSALSVYNENPTEFAVQKPAATEEGIIILLRLAIGCFEGVDAKIWEERTGIALDEVLEQEWIRPHIESLERLGNLTRDEHGVRLQRDRIAETLIELGWESTPVAGRT